MRFLKYTSAFIIPVLLASCSSPSASSSSTVKPAIQNGVYTSSIGNQSDDGAFSIQFPDISVERLESGKALYENKGPEPKFTYVSFQPRASDLTTYRVEVNQAYIYTPFDEYKHKLLPLLVSNIEKESGQAMQKISEVSTTFKGHPELCGVYVQHMPSEKGSYALTHSICYVDYGGYVALFAVTGDSRSPVNPITDKNVQQVVNRTWAPMVDFMNSFQLMPTKARS